jgi:hypothetical protein
LRSTKRDPRLHRLSRRRRERQLGKSSVVERCFLAIAHPLVDSLSALNLSPFGSRAGDPQGLPQDTAGAHGISDDRITAFMRGYWAPPPGPCEEGGTR